MFFIVQVPAANRCTIAEEPPNPRAGPSNPLPTNPPYSTLSQAPSQPMPTSTVVVGDGAYGDRATAEADMKAIAGCAGGRQEGPPRSFYGEHAFARSACLG